MKAKEARQSLPTGARATDRIRSDVRPGPSAERLELVQRIKPALRVARTRPNVWQWSNWGRRLRIEAAPPASQDRNASPNKRTRRSGGRRLKKNFATGGVTDSQSPCSFLLLSCNSPKTKGFVNDPSAGSPTETLLRLLLPLNDQVRSSFRSGVRPPEAANPGPIGGPH